MFPSTVMRLWACVLLLGCETVNVRPALEPVAETSAAEESVSAPSNSPAAVTLSVGPRSSCAVLADTSLWCWGDGSDALLGGDVGPGPVRIVESGVTQVSVGYSRVCYDAEGETYCFGDLGGRNPVKERPVRVDDLGSVTDIATGHRHACFIDANKRARCYGNDSYAGLHQDTGRPRLSEVLVENAESIAAGTVHSCASAGGSVSCWGFAAGGRLGGANVRYFTDSPRELSSLQGARSVSSYPTGSQTCALLTGDEIRCWGTTGGALRESRRMLVSPEPVPLEPVGEPLAKIVVGLVQVLAIAESGAAYRYAAGDGEAIENPNTSLYSREPTARTRYGAAARLNLPPVSHVGVGLAYSCALTREGAVLCWGLGAGGRLGNGSNESQAEPTPVHFEANE